MLKKAVTSRPRETGNAEKELKRYDRAELKI